MFLQLDTRGLLRTRATPLTMDQTGRLRGARPCRSATSEGDRRVPARVNLGRGHAGQTVTVAVAETTLSIDLGDGDTRVVSRTTTMPVRRVKAFRLRDTTA